MLASFISFTNELKSSGYNTRSKVLGMALLILCILFLLLIIFAVSKIRDLKEDQKSIWKAWEFIKKDHTKNQNLLGYYIEEAIYLRDIIVPAIVVVLYDFPYLQIGGTAFFMASVFIIRIKGMPFKSTR